MRWFKIVSTKQEAEALLASGKMLLITVAGNRICFGRLGDQYFAIEDECPHRGGSLSEGVINYLGEVVCPMHAYRYHHKTGQECELKTRNAKTFPLEWREDGLFIGVE